MTLCRILLAHASVTRDRAPSPVAAPTGVRFKVWTSYVSLCDIVGRARQEPLAKEQMGMKVLEALHARYDTNQSMILADNLEQLVLHTEGKLTFATARSGTEGPGCVLSLNLTLDAACQCMEHASCSMQPCKFRCHSVLVIRDMVGQLLRQHHL